MALMVFFENERDYRLFNTKFVKLEEVAHDPLSQRYWGFHLKRLKVLNLHFESEFPYKCSLKYIM